MNTVSPQQRREKLESLDTQLEELKRQFENAVESLPVALGELAANEEYDVSLDKRMRSVVTRLRNLKPEIDTLELELEQTNRLLSSIIEVDRAMNTDRPELDRLESLLIGLERVRQVLRDALDEFVGNERDRKSLALSIEKMLPGVPQVEIAALLGVDPRTLRRWLADSGRGTASPRLWLVAKLVAILSHAWTPSGITAWFTRPRRDLDGKTPSALLAEPESVPRLLAAARSARNQYGS